MSHRRRLRDRINRSRKHFHRRCNNKSKTKHHNKAKSLGGAFSKENIFILTTEHHRAYHLLFGLRTFKEAAAVLLRMDALHAFAKGDKS